MLSVKNITSFYGKSQALFDVSLEVKVGEVVALMGRNGVGKSTTIRAICNLTPAATGEIHLVGKNIKKLASHKVAQIGIGLVPEGRRCFPNLTVYENLVATARESGTINNWDIEKINALFPRLTERFNQVASTLSGGEQQMLAIGRALLTNPKLLILDEATEGLAPIVRQEIWAAIRPTRPSSLRYHASITSGLSRQKRCWMRSSVSKMQPKTPSSKQASWWKNIFSRWLKMS